MAVTLTESEKLKCAQILGVTYIEVNDKIFNLGESYITPAVEELIRTELTRWETYGTQFTDVVPFGENNGAKYSVDKVKSNIRKNIANLLYIPTNNIGSGQTRLVRG